MTGKIGKRGKQRWLESAFDTEYSMEQVEAVKANSEGIQAWAWGILQRELAQWGKYYSETGRREPLWVQLSPNGWAYWDELDWCFHKGKANLLRSKGSWRQGEKGSVGTYSQASFVGYSIYIKGYPRLMSGLEKPERKVSSLDVMLFLDHASDSDKIGIVPSNKYIHVGKINLRPTDASCLLF